jgi:hypothetical protein
MAINPDFSDLFASLNAAGARYLLVGSYALAIHAQPRFTKDLDVWVSPDPENARRVINALTEFGAPMASLTVADLAAPGLVFQIGIPPNRIDVLTAIDGVSFDEAWSRHVVVTYGPHDIAVIGKADLIRNKRATGRAQDALDADTLERGE